MRHFIYCANIVYIKISIHASRMGCDFAAHLVMLVVSEFQSTHPVWDATRYCVKHSGYPTFQSTHPVWDATSVLAERGGDAVISIHASRMGCDRGQANDASRSRHFNPRIPYGMRHRSVNSSSVPSIFQSTHPVWDATARMDIAFHNMEIIARSSS